MSKNVMEDIISHRKRDHIRICLEENVQFEKTNGLDQYELTHVALPEIDRSKIDTSLSFLGKNFSAPIFIEAMTGGVSDSKRINQNLSGAAQKCGIGMGLGSQRAMIVNPSLLDTYLVRKMAPDILLFGNIGATQLKEICSDDLKRAIEVVEADALAIHLNVTQELCQPEGDTNWENILKEIEAVCKDLSFPIIVKETGCGISPITAKEIENVGVSCIDIGGAGGTCWARVEHFRGSKNARLFFDWGIPTADSLVECAKAVHIPIIASGGIRNGKDIIKAISLGAALAGMAFPFLKLATLSTDHVIMKIEQIKKEIADTMFLTGVNTIKNIRESKIIKMK
jgi:isopentenyl-diphosphate Delta-isomerase